MQARRARTQLVSRNSRDRFDSSEIVHVVEINGRFQETVGADPQAVGDTEQTIVNEPRLRGTARSSHATAALGLPENYILDGTASTVRQIAIVVQDLARLCSIGRQSGGEDEWPDARRKSVASVWDDDVGGIVNANQRVLVPRSPRVDRNALDLDVKEARREAFNPIERDCRIGCRSQLRRHLLYDIGAANVA